VFKFSFSHFVSIEPFHFSLAKEPIKQKSLNKPMEFRDKPTNIQDIFIIASAICYLSSVTSKDAII